jgi:hypothetical protein
MSREEHLAWCKKRALEYLDDGDINSAIASMISDLARHPETQPDNWALIALANIYVAERDLDGAHAWIVGWR